MKKALPWIALAALGVWYFLFRKPAAGASTMPGASSLGGGVGTAGAPGGASSLQLLLGGGGGAAAASPFSGLFGALGKSAAALVNQGLNGYVYPLFNSPATTPQNAGYDDSILTGDSGTFDNTFNWDNSFSNAPGSISDAVNSDFGGSGSFDFGGGSGVDLSSGLGGYDYSLPDYSSFDFSNY